MGHFVFAQENKDQRYNRFQYHKLRWRVFHADAYHIYYPMYADSLSSFIARQYPDAVSEVKKRMISGLDKAPNIVVYPSVDQYYESNIGSFEPQQYTLPTLVVKGNRLVLSFTGSYSDLKAQLQETIARSVWERKIKEGSMENQAKGPKGEAIPMWFKEGAIRYFAHGWTVQAEDALKLSFRQNSFLDWYQVISYQPRLSGQALCYFLSEKYFKMAPAQVFNQLKKKDLQRSLRLLTKKDLNILFAQCFDFYKDRFSIEIKKPISSTGYVFPHKEGIVRTITVSPDEKYIAYTATAKGKRTVYVCDSRSKVSIKVTEYTLPPWISDHSKDQYPLVRWASNGRELQIAMPVKGKVTIQRYTPGGSQIEATKLYGVDGIHSFQSLSDREYLLAGYRRGQSDNVTYNERREKYMPYTTDIYEDSHPVSVGKSIFFLSDRPKDSIEKKLNPMLWQGIYSVESKKIEAIDVDTIEYNRWTRLQQLSDGNLIGTNTKTGTERFVLIYPNGHTQELSEYIPFQYNKERDRISFYKVDKDSIYLSSMPFKEWVHQASREQNTQSPWLADYLKRKQEEAKEDSILRAAKSNNPSILDDVFAVANAKDTAKKNTHEADDDSYDPRKAKPYILQLHSAYFSAKVNNDYFGNRYQPYLNYQGQFKVPEIGGMAQGGFTDLFENHHISIAYRLPAGSEGSNFFFSYLNIKKKTDWGITYYRNVESLKPDPKRYWVNGEGKPYPNLAKVKTHYYEVLIQHPLTYDMGIGFQQAIRSDQTIFQATDRYSLEFEDISSIWSISTLSFDINKLHPTIPNLYRGFYGKIVVDAFKGFTQEEAALLGSTVQVAYHLPLYKYITLVAQGRVGYSSGDNYLLYNLGGTDNNVAPKVDSTVHFPQNAPYAFQTLVTPLRGFLQNSVYGNQYALLNLDIYFPLFETLIPIETPLPSINQLQLGLFSDIATAKETWKGAANTTGNVNISYGLSARTTLTGYPLRLEMAWPGTFAQRPIWYFSLSLR